ncbi:alpha-glucan family phosphorylase [Desulfurivibrio alkaliphilus]|uniref:glycogen phosphorylase n=1 Tax=Desulfurivibrio alkaliphilus (strain DSM 19089 / UNIQEM U267 / AHT2) TaxID=589865 RepID=D6Z2F9_DESAT|nr:alpha-glucan family phosphorylase [Desulfurivibrio alkaliphilus]ADH85734.1 alpha-glucan phosphorylase [Desulfurivibrio alkaliphilus AHT 2]
MKSRQPTPVDLTATSPYGTFFGVSQACFDQVWQTLTGPKGQSVTYVSMEIGADRDVYHPIKNLLQEMGKQYKLPPDLSPLANKFLHGPEKIPTYSGGLGILAGDTLKSFADCKIPVAAISLLYRHGYFSQLVDMNLGQVAWRREWEPEAVPGLYPLHQPGNPDQPLTVTVDFHDQQDQPIQAVAQVWLKMEIGSGLDFFVPEILLDYDIPASPEWIRKSSHQLYDSSSEASKAIQRRLLGAGVLPVMRTLGLTSDSIHLNEQHGVVLVLALISEILHRRLGDDFRRLADDREIMAAAEEAARHVVYTIHTPVKAGHDRFPRSLYHGLEHSFFRRILQLLAEDEQNPEAYNFTALAMRVNRATNSVSRLHREVTRTQFPQFKERISAITNGVHHLTWISENKAQVYDSAPELAGWRHDPSVFRQADKLLKSTRFRQAFATAWQADSKYLIDHVNAMLAEHRQQRISTWIDPPNYLSYLDEKESRLDYRTFTFGFARRFSTYKRADLVFEDLDHLARILVDQQWPINFIYAGKAHPADEPGQGLIKTIIDIQEELYQRTDGLARLVFIPDYDMAVAKMMVAGCHAWLNSPKRPLEASGTSGMKAAMNGVPNVSIMDGWWVEGYHEGQTGWKFGYEGPVNPELLSEQRAEMLYSEDAASFYETLPDILATFYQEPEPAAYLDRGLMNLALNCPIFNTHRMAAEYVARYGLDLPQDIAEQMAKFRSLYRSDLE